MSLLNHVIVIAAYYTVGGKPDLLSRIMWLLSSIHIFNIKTFYKGRVHFKKGQDDGWAFPSWSRVSQEDPPQGEIFFNALLHHLEPIQKK